jgi:hypothetical protein
VPRRERPAETTRSERWLRVGVNDARDFLNARVIAAFGWPTNERIVWRSPIKEDDYAEYCDQAFLERLNVQASRTPLSSFWPNGGPRWDGLATTDSGKVLVVEAKAHIDESVDYHSDASAESYRRIQAALAAAKSAFRASEKSSWESPFYQYANRLAHLYFLRALNAVDAYLLFLYFADAPDVPEPCSTVEWRGAIRLTKKCLGLGAHAYQAQVKDLIVSVPELLSNTALNADGKVPPN